MAPKSNYDYTNVKMESWLSSVEFVSEWNQGIVLLFKELQCILGAPCFSVT